MENKKSKTGLHVFVGILLGIIICGVVVFATYELGYLTFNGKEEKVDTENDNATHNDQTEEDATSSSLEFDTSKVVNGNGTQYYLTNYNSTINIRLDETRQIVTLNYNRKILSDTYGLNWDTTDMDEYTYEDKQLNFDKPIKDIFYGGVGQDVSGDIILFLMDDGTVEYIPVYQALSTSGIDGLVSYGTLQGVENVIKFYTAYAMVGLTGNYSTTLIQTEDGMLYDLGPIINSTNNNE